MLEKIQIFILRDKLSQVAFKHFDSFLVNLAGIILSFLITGCTANEARIASHDNASQPKKQTGKSTLIVLPKDSAIFSELTYSIAEYRDIDFSVLATGQLQANANTVTRVSSPITGKVVSVRASVGDAVKKDQELLFLSSQEIATLESDLYKSEAEIDSELSRDLLELDCELQQAEAQLGLCDKQYERAKLLYEEKIAAVAALESTKTELEKQHLMIAALKRKRERTVYAAEQKKRLGRVSAEQRLHLLGMPISVVKRVMATRALETSIPVVTPQGGIVLERSVNSGEIVEPSKILFVVDDLDNLWLIADIFEQEIDLVKTGQHIEFTVDSFPKQIFHGKLNFVAGTINPETRTLAVRAEVANPGFKLKPKMFARMKIFTGKHRALTIPRSAVQDAGSRKVVYISLSRGCFNETAIEIGEESGPYVQILKGLKPGDKVVTTGSFSLRAQSLKGNR